MTVVGAAGPTPEPVVRLRGVSRRYDGALALAPVSLSLHPGTATLVTGHNGSGKSTLLRLVAGLLRPSTGSREADGRALYLLAGDGARAVEPARAAVVTAARLAGLTRGEAVQAAASALDAVGLARLADRPVGTFSSGQRARVSLAVALACPTAVVCLDEPTAHLDSDGAALVTATMATLTARGSAVLVATHDPAAHGWPVDAHLQLEEGVVRSLGHPARRPEAVVR